MSDVNNCSGGEMCKVIENRTGPIIGVHIDLKGYVFRSDYIPQLMRDLAQLKVNTVLVEYEDVFPFEGINVAYDPKTICITLPRNWIRA